MTVWVDVPVCSIGAGVSGSPHTPGTWCHRALGRWPLAVERGDDRRLRTVPLRVRQCCQRKANAVSEKEATELFETFAVPASGAPLFQAAAANLNSWTEARVETETPTADQC